MPKKLLLSLASVGVLSVLAFVAYQGNTGGLRSVFLNADGSWDYSDEQGGGASTPQNVADYVDPNTSNGTYTPSNSGASNPTNGASSTGSNGVTSCSSQQTEFDQKDSLLKEVQSKLDSITQNKTTMTARKRTLESKTVDKKHPDYETIKQAIDKVALGGPGGVIDKTTMNAATLKSLLAIADAKIKPIMSALYTNTKQKTVSDWYQVHFYNQQDILLQNYTAPSNGGGGFEFWSLNDKYLGDKARLFMENLSTKETDAAYQKASNELIKKYPKAGAVQKKIMAIWSTEAKYVWPTAKKLMYPEGNRHSLDMKIKEVEKELVQIKADFVELPNLPQRIQTLTHERDTAQRSLNDCNTKLKENGNGNGAGNNGTGVHQECDTITGGKCEDDNETGGTDDQKDCSHIEDQIAAKNQEIQNIERESQYRREDLNEMRQKLLDLQAEINDLVEKYNSGQIPEADKSATAKKINEMKDQLEWDNNNYEQESLDQSQGFDYRDSLIDALRDEIRELEKALDQCRYGS